MGRPKQTERWEYAVSKLTLMVTMVLVWLTGCGQAPEPHVILEASCERCGRNEPVLDGCEQCYELGTQAMALTRPDVERARNMYAKACRVHHPEACNALAEMCRDARGGPPDLPRAATLFGIACEKGPIQSACTERGLALYDGEGIKADQEAAVTIFDSACNHESDPQPKACASLGIAYLEGNGVERRDEDKAIDLIRRSCEADYAPGCVQMGEMFAKRTRGSRKENLTTASDSYDRACDIDARYGCFELADMHKEGRAVDASPEKAAIYYQRTCNIDPTRGCYEAAELMSSGKVEAREGEIAALYNVACEHGHNDACSRRSPE